MHEEIEAMVKTSMSLYTALLATTLLMGGSAWAANMTPETKAPVKMAAATTGQGAVDKDIDKISADGSDGFMNILLARRAIFEGRTGEAKKYVALAETEFDKAKSEGAVYKKAESELVRSADRADGGKSSMTAATPASNKGEPIAWVPVDASVTIAEDITGNAAKTAAVSDADKSLQTGDREGAVKKLKNAGIEVEMVLAVMPLEKTIEDVHKAAELIDSGKYYEGSQQLRLAEAGERFDAIGDFGTPKE